jgi:hypothetical protein
MTNDDHVALCMPGVAATGRFSLMEWTSDNGEQTYTTTRGSCRATITRNLTGGWTAVVGSTRLTIGRNSFTTREVAQAWCERELGELAATEECRLDYRYEQ